MTKKSTAATTTTKKTEVLSKKERLLNQYSNWLRMRNYSLTTYKAYTGTIRAFWRYCEEQQDNPKFEKAQAVQSYLAYRMHHLKRDYSTVNGDYSALMWFYKYILNREWNVRKLIRPKKEKRLPRYITPQQVADLLDAVSCEKHRLMILMYYSTGMRLSEVRLLLWENVNFEEGVIWVRKGKGNKDRVVILAEKLAQQLQAYRQLQRPTQRYVFEGGTPGQAIAPKTIQGAIIIARRKAGLPDWISAHVLRHSFATASLQNGTDLLSLKALLGHKKLSTTSRYMHLHLNHYKNLYNPIDNSCLSAHLQFPSHPDIPSVASSDSSAPLTSSSTSPTTAPKAS